MSEKPLAELTAHELTGPAHLCRTLIPSDAVVVEIRRRLEQGERDREALEKAPHAKECQSLRDHHLPGFIHYETDGDEPCPEYHYRKGACNCYRAALDAARAEGK